jgi:CIC family chloride channel protein
MPRHVKPAVGAFLTGVIGLALYYFFGRQEQTLAVISFGYSALQHAMIEETTAAAGVLMAVALGKILTTSFTIGSGGSGGVFGPSMVIGGCAGGALGLVLHQFWPNLVPHPASFAIVGMAVFFAAAAKTPFSTLVIVSEMTGGYHLLLPTLWVSVLAFMLSDEQSIYHAQVESRSRSPAHQGSFVREALANVRVSQFLKPGLSVPTLHPNDSLSAIIQRLARTDHPMLPVVDDANRLVGIVSLEEVHFATQSPHLESWVLAEDLMRTRVSALTPQDTIDRALELFIENDLLALPIVNDPKDRQVIGIVRRSDIGSAYLRYVHGKAAAQG